MNSIRDIDVIKEYLKNGARIWYWYLSGGVGLFPVKESKTYSIKCYSIPIEIFLDLRKNKFIDTDCVKHIDCVVHCGKYQEYKITSQH